MRLASRVSRFASRLDARWGAKAPHLARVSRLALRLASRVSRWGAKASRVSPCVSRLAFRVSLSKNASAEARALCFWRFRVPESKKNPKGIFFCTPALAPESKHSSSENRVLITHLRPETSDLRPRVCEKRVFGEACATLFVDLGLRTRIGTPKTLKTTRSS